MRRPIHANHRVAELVMENSARAGVLDRFGIDYCCGGRKTLAAACDEGGLDLEMVLRELHDADAKRRSGKEPDWSRKPVGALIDHIIDCHHTYLQEALPRISHLLSLVAKKHAEKHPEMSRVREVFEPLRIDLETHMDREELEIFPAIRDLDVAGRLHDPWPADLVEMVEGLRDEHETGDRALARIQELARNFAPPEDVGNNYRSLLEELEALRADIHLHVHEENNILYAIGLPLAETGTGY